MRDAAFKRFSSKRNLICTRLRIPGEITAPASIGIRKVSGIIDGRKFEVTDVVDWKIDLFSGLLPTLASISPYLILYPLGLNHIFGVRRRSMIEIDGKPSITGTGGLWYTSLQAIDKLVGDLTITTADNA